MLLYEPELFFRLIVDDDLDEDAVRPEDDEDDNGGKDALAFLKELGN